MPHIVANPAELHDPGAFGYSHTASVPTGTDLVFVAGQYASNTAGEVVSSEFGEQVERAFANLGIALADHGLDLRHVVQLRTYVVDHDFGRLGAIVEAVRDGWGATPPTHTVIGVAALATPDVLFEVEAVAAHP